MDAAAVNAAIDKTSLKGRLTAEDIERWRQADNQRTEGAPLWLSVLISMAATLDIAPAEMNAILQATMPRGEKLATRNPSDKTLVEIDPTAIIDLSLAADTALKQGQSERAQALWLELIRTVFEQRMTPAEPYRLFGNLASTAFINGELFLAEAALEIALHLNPNYSFGRKLAHQAENGEFLQYSLQKLATKPMPEIVTTKDLEMLSTEDILQNLGEQGIALDEARFKMLAAPIADTINILVDQLLATAKDREPNEDYVYAACEVLWDRLITRPLFETFEEILYDLEDSEPDSNLYFDLIKKLGWAFTKADKAVFAYYQKYPYERAGLRYTLHDLLAYEVIRQSSVAETMLGIAESALQSGYFPDMMVHDIVRRIADGKNWQHQLEAFIQKHAEHAQVIAMGVARGLLELGENHEVIGVCRQLAWDKVLSGELPPEGLAIHSIGDYLLAAYENLGDKTGIKQTESEADIIDRKLAALEQQEAEARRAKHDTSSLTFLKKLGTYPEVVSYYDFLESLGLDFSTDTPTDDKLSSFITQPDRKIGRNEECPCGSGKKYKKCHGSLL